MYKRTRIIVPNGVASGVKSGARNFVIRIAATMTAMILKTNFIH